MQKLSVLFVIIFVFLMDACSTNHGTTSEILSVKGNGSENSSILDQRTKLHAILVADTENRGADWLDFSELKKKEEIGTKKDLTNVRKFLETIKEDVTAVDLKLHILEGKEFTHKNVITAISQLTPNESDVILFYYTGHGVNERGYGFPNLILGKNKHEQPILDDIVSKIKEKNTHFSIILADACNNYSQEAMNGDAIKGIADDFRFMVKKDSFSKLFLDIYGHVVGIASKDGQFATGSADGGKFTNQVLVNLNKELTSDTPTWDNFKKGTEIPIPYTLKGGVRDTQNPSIEISLGGKKTTPHPVAVTAVSIKILPTTRLSVGSNIQIQFTNQSRDTSGFLVAWDIDSRDKVTLIVPSLEEIKLEPMETKPATSKVVEPIGKSFLVAVLVEDRRKFDVLKGLKPANRQQLLNQLQQQGLKLNQVEYEIIK